MAPKSIRIDLAQLGEWYANLLTVDAALNASTETSLAIANIKYGLNAKKTRIRETVQYLADQRNIPYQQMWNEILNGKYKQLPPD